MKKLFCSFCIVGFLTSISSAEETIWEARSWAHFNMAQSQEDKDAALLQLNSERLIQGKEMIDLPETSPTLNVWEARDAANSKPGVQHYATPATTSQAVPKISIWEAHDRIGATDWEMNQNPDTTSLPTYTIWDAMNYRAWVEWQRRQQAAAYWQRMAYFQQQQAWQRQTLPSEMSREDVIHEPISEPQEVAAVIVKPEQKSSPAPEQEQQEAHLEIQTETAHTTATLPEIMTEQQQDTITTVAAQQMSTEQLRIEYKRETRRLQRVIMVSVAVSVPLILMMGWALPRMLQEIRHLIDTERGGK